MKNLSSLKITGGEFSGREIKSPESTVTHPMGSRERLAIMNSIGPDIKDKVVLDCFAGTGAIGIEALSRGAKHVTFIEKNHKTADILRSNIRSLGLEDRTRVFETDVNKIDFDQKFDFCFADPPYDYFKSIKTLDLDRIAKLARIKFILSHPADFDPHILSCNLLSTKSYAGARISCYNNE